MSKIATEGFGSIFSEGATPSNPDGGAYSGGGTNVVVWCPDSDTYPDPLPSGWHREWADAVAAVQALTDPDTVIRIAADPEEWTATIPHGTWQLNNTLIQGAVSNSDTDTDFRGWQELLQVNTEGITGQRTKILGCRGLKDIYFRSYETQTTTTTTEAFEVPAAYSQVAIPVSDTTDFEIGKVVYIDGAGYYRIDLIQDLLVTFFNLNYSGNASPTSNINSGAAVYPDDAVFHASGYDLGSSFTLDNVDFHFGNYHFGSLYIPEDSDVFIYMMNRASLRWYSIRMDGYAVVETDGSGCWIGTNAIAGASYVDVFPMAGCQCNTTQAIPNFTLHQPYIQYLPQNPTDWSRFQDTGVPSSHHQALDYLASHIRYQPQVKQNTASAPQTTNLTAGSRLVLDHEIYSQDGWNSLITLQDGGYWRIYYGNLTNSPAYKLTASLGPLFDGTVMIQWWDATNNVAVGLPSGNIGNGVSGEAVAFLPQNYSPTPVDIEVRIIFASGTTFIGESTGVGFVGPWATLEQVGSY